MVILDVNIRGSWVTDIWELSVLFLQLFSKSKIISKEKVRKEIILAKDIY